MNRTRILATGLMMMAATPVWAGLPLGTMVLCKGQSSVIPSGAVTYQVNALQLHGVATGCPTGNSSDATFSGTGKAVETDLNGTALLDVVTINVTGHGALVMVNPGFNGATNLFDSDLPCNSPDVVIIGCTGQYDPCNGVMHLRPSPTGRKDMCLATFDTN